MCYVIGIALRVCMSTKFDILNFARLHFNNHPNMLVVAFFLSLKFSKQGHNYGKAGFS